VIRQRDDDAACAHRGRQPPERGIELTGSSADALDELWNEAKALASSG